MSKKTKDPQRSQNPKKNFEFFLGSRQRYIRINCDFDSGNIDVVKQLTQFSYRLESVLDGSRTGHKVNSKSWFHFSVEGFPKNTKGKFTINRVQTLCSVFNSKYTKSYRPVYKIHGKQKWHRLPTQANLIMRQSGELQCVFQYLFKSEQEKVYFAFCYPFSYKEHITYMNDLNEFLYIDDFYFYKEIFIKSPQKRDVHILTITSYDHKNKGDQKEELFNDKLFPEKVRPLKFNKPVVLISARVHPGQTPASYAMQGILQFLTNKHDLRANLLRKMFVFMIIPMINVDGVYHGHFRMDIYGKNLNRFYLNPDPIKQPAIYAIKQLANHLTKQNRLSFYFDLHAHNAKKGHFIYGNAINDFVQQVESQVFCKLFAMNHKGFEYNYCNFSQKHMNAKDQNEDMTKQGCGRVVMYRLANIIHSYSLQCGIISPNKINELPDPINTDFRIKDKHLLQDPLQLNKNPIYTQSYLFTQDMYRNLGKNLLVSILDVFDKNPYNRIYNSNYKSMDMLRRITAFEIFHNTERFRMFQRFVYGKVKNINQLIKQVLNQKLHYKQLYNFYFFDDKELKHIKWPENIPGLSKPIQKTTSPHKMRKLRSLLNQPKKQYQNQFYQILQKNKQINQQQSAYLATSRMLLFHQNNNNNNNNNNNIICTNQLQDQHYNQSYYSQKHIHKHHQAQQNNYNYEQQQQQYQSSRSSETQDYSPIKTQNQFNEQQFLDFELKEKQKQFNNNIYNNNNDNNNDNNNYYYNNTITNTTEIHTHQNNNNNINSLLLNDRNFSNMLIGLKKKDIVQFNSLKLQQVQCQDYRGRSTEKYQNNQSPSVRVRRLLKQENVVMFSNNNNNNNNNNISNNNNHHHNNINPKNSTNSTHSNNTNNPITSSTSTNLPAAKRSTIIQTRISQCNIFNKDSLIQSIKQDIKLQLKRQQQRKLSQIRCKQNYLSHMGYFGDRGNINNQQNHNHNSGSYNHISANNNNINNNQKGRIRSTSVRNHDKDIKVNPNSKIQLPALGTHFFIISSSNRAINKKF